MSVVLCVEFGETLLSTIGNRAVDLSTVKTEKRPKVCTNPNLARAHNFWNIAELF
jgi:hypothetical protein